MTRKASGKNHRKSLTFIELMKIFPDDTSAEKWFTEQRWPKGPHCPHCGSFNVQFGVSHRSMTHRCRDCKDKKMFSLKIGTLMEGSKLNYQVWAIAIHLLSTNLKSVSSMKLHRDLGITQKSAWHLAHRLRKSFDINGKVSHSNIVKASVITDTDEKTLKEVAPSKAVPSAAIYTDGNRTHYELNDYKTVQHDVATCVHEQIHMQPYTTVEQKIKIRALVNKWISDNFPIQRKYITHTKPEYSGAGLWVVDLLAKKCNSEILGSLQINKDLSVIKSQDVITISKKLDKLLKNNYSSMPALPGKTVGKYHEFIHGDGITAAEMMCNRSIDLLLTDPPYGISNPYTCEKQVSRRIRKDGSDFIMPKGHFGDWDYNFSPDKWTKIVLPKVSGWAVIFCAQAQIGEYSDLLKSHNFNAVGTFVWQKTNPVPFNHTFKPINAWESVVLGKRPGTKFNGRVVHNIFKCKSPSPQERIHPTQKPVLLIERFIELFSNEDDLIFDPFAGSATTVVTANRMKRKIIAYEKDRDFYQAAFSRLKESIKDE